MRLTKHNILKFLFINLFLFISYIFIFNIPYSYKKRVQIFAINKRDSFFNSKLSNCEVKVLKEIPYNSSLVIGHAYGAPTSDNNFLSKKVTRILNKNINKINFIFFSGDVLKNPNKKNWDLLAMRYPDKVIIAPGNHDLGFNKNLLRKTFKNSLVFYKDFPYLIKEAGFNVIVEDSTLSNWQINQNTIKKINEIRSNLPTVLIRHHIPIKELTYLANSYEGKTQYLMDVKSLTNKISRNIIIISGDSGAFKFQPRYSCKKYQGNTFIVNGIGEIKNDMILVLKDSKIYRFKI